MNKKIWIIIVGLIILAGAIVGGYFIWQKYYQKSSTNTKEATTESKKDEPKIPKVEKYDVPILMYHYIRNAEGESELGQNLSVSPANFDAHLKWLKDDGYQSIKLAGLADPNKKAISQVIYDKKKPIVITFDDGYLDAYTEAFPTLKKYGFFGTFFIIRNYVEKAEYMNQKQINELAGAGMEIGSHSLSHPDLASLDIASAQKQITDSKLEATVFCYPAGKFNETVVSLVKEAGYLAAVTTKFGIANQDSNLLELRRVRIENGSAETLKEKIEAAYAQTPK